MECDVEGQPNDEVSPNEGVLKDDMELKNDVDINVSSSTESDIEEKLGREAKSDEDFTSGEAENSLGDLTENNPCSGNSLETVGNNAKVENEKSVDEKLENQNLTEKCISDAVKNTLAEDVGKICDKLEEPNSTNKLTDKSRIDLLDKENVTDVEKSFEINSSAVDTEPKSPEIGFRRKSFSQVSPLSSPAKSPSQMSEKSPVRSPELGGRRKLKVHVFDRELSAADGETSKQEQSSERKEDENVVKEGKTLTPDFMGKEHVAENQESSPSQVDNTASTSPCFEEECSKDLNLSDSDKCIQDVMEGGFFNKLTQDNPLPRPDKLSVTTELSKEASPHNKPVESFKRKLSLSFYKKETTSLSAEENDEKESDIKNSSSSEDFYKEKESDLEKPEDGIAPKKPEDSIAMEKCDENIAPEKLEDSVAPEEPEDSISSENHEDSIPFENSEDSITSEKPEDIIAPEEPPEDSIPSENPEDSMPYENPDDSIPSENHEDSIPSENLEDSKPSEKQENSIATENPDESIPSENPEDSIHSEKQENSITTENPDESISSENPEDSMLSEKLEDSVGPENPDESIPSENREDRIHSEKLEDGIAPENPDESIPLESSEDSMHSEKLEDSIGPANPDESIPSETPEDSIHSEKLEDGIAPESPDESIPLESSEDSIHSYKSEDSVHSDKYEDSIAPEKPMDIAPEKPDDSIPPEKPDDSIAPEKPNENIAPEKPTDSLAHEKPEDSVASKKPEKPEDSIAFQDEISSTVDNDGNEISLTEKSENSVTLLQETLCASDSGVNTEAHGVLKSDDKVKNSNDRKEKDIESDLFFNDISGNRSVQCSADTSNKREFDDQLLKVAREETSEGKTCEEDTASEEEEVRHNQESPSVEKPNNLEINKCLVKQNEFSQAQERGVDNDSGTELDVIVKNRTLLNEFQIKSDNRSESETQEESAEKRSSLKIVLKIGLKRKSSDHKKETLGKKVIDKCDESGNAPAEFECSEKRLRKSSEIGNFHEDENVCHKKVIGTKSIGSPDSGRKYSQDGEENFVDCPQEGESQKGCEELESGELIKANYKEEVSNMDKNKVNKPSGLLSLSKRRALADQEREKMEVGDKDDDKPLTTDTEISITEGKARADERSQEDNQKVGIAENDQGSGNSSDGSYEGMRVSGEDTEKDNSLPESDILNPSERVQGIASATLGNEKLQLTGDSLGDEGSGGTHVMKRKKRSHDPGKLRGAPGPKRFKVSLDAKENTDHNSKDDVEVSSSGTSPVDMKVEFVDISSEEEQQSESRYVDAIDMVCKKCRDIWNDEVLRMIFKGTESVTVNSKITYGAIVCINDWINRNLSVDKEEAITQVFERTDLGSNIAQLNISKLDQWLGELLHKGKNKCCKVFTAVYQPKKDTALHKTKTATKRPKVHVPQSNPIHTKNQKSAVSKGQKSFGTKGPSVAKSQSPTVNKSQNSVIATCPDLPKGRVYLVPAPAVASVLPNAISTKSLPSEESAVLPSSASSLMKPCKIILKNPVPIRPKGNTQNSNRPSSKSHPSGSSAGLKSGESKSAVSSKFACGTNGSKKASIGKPGLSSSHDKSLRATVHGNTINSKELSKTGVNKLPLLHQARPLAVPLSKMMSHGQNQRAQVNEDEQDELEDVKDFVTEVESMIFSQEPVIREMLQDLNLDIKDVNIYSSYCNIPVNNKMKVDCPSERDKISPCYFSMLKERSALNGHALIAFDLLLYESNNQHSVASLGSTKSRFVTKRELLTLQSIFILNPETPDISLFYEVFVQILLSRKKVLLIPDSHTFLVVTEDIRKEYNRVKSKDLSIQILNENWDPNNIYSVDDVWLEGQNLEEVTNRDVISIFCTWRNLGKEPSDQSLSKALQSLRQFHNIKNGDYFGSCFRLYTKFIRIVYEEKDLELAKVFLDEPFIGGCCIVSKKFLQNLINFNKQKNNLPNYDDDVDEFKGAVERFEELEAVAYESLNAPILRDLCSQMIIVEEKMKVFVENNEVISKRLTDLLGKREKLLREIKGPEIRRLVQTMRSSIVELHKVAQKRHQESYYSKKNKKKCDLDMKGSDLDSSCTDVSPHIKELIKDLLSKGVKPDKVRQVIGIVSGITKEEKMLEIPSEKWILNFAHMYS